MGSRFLPFGEELNAQSSPHDRKLFTGQERDFETALDYLHARRGLLRGHNGDKVLLLVEH